MWPRLRSFFHGLLRRPQFEQEMDFEFRAHRQAYIADLVKRGLSQDEAERRANIEFGSESSLKEECRESRGLRWPDEFRRDFVYAFRLLRRSPAFTLSVVATLALCTGANTAVYSVVDAVLVRALPYPHPERLALVVTMHRGSSAQYEQNGQNGKTCKLVRDNATAIDAAVKGGANGVNMMVDGGPQYVEQQRVSAGFFRVLGVEPMIGREFSLEEDRTGGASVAVLSYDLWQRVLGGDRGVVGRKILLKGQPYTVIGVMPRGFRSGDLTIDLWTPLRPSSSGEGGGINYELIARVRDNATWVQANTELASLSHGLPPDEPGVKDTLELVPLQKGLTEDARNPLYLLWSAVGLVLLIGCVNIMSLLLAQAAPRTREIATRMALGGGRPAVVRQLLAESFLLALAGSAVGIVLGRVALRGLQSLASGALGVGQTTVELNGRVLAVSILTALVASLLFGLYPALLATRVDIRSALVQGGSRGASGSHRSWSRRLLVITEVALSVVLLIGAGLLTRSFAHLTGLAPGFDATNVSTARLSLDDARYATSEQVNRLFDESVRRMEQIPDVDSAGVGLTLPYERALNDGMKVLDGPHPSKQFQIMNMTYVTPGYLKALRIHLLNGRLFETTDTSTSRPVAIVTEAFVHKYLPDQNPLGSHVRIEDSDREVVGVVADVLQGAGWGGFAPIARVPSVYIPASQTSGGFFQLVHVWFMPSWVVRTRVPRAGIGAELQRAVSSIDPQLPFARFESMDEIRSVTLAFQRSTAALLGILAGIALLLAAVGIYGLIANAVVERTREIGIRMALGSSIQQAIAAVTGPGFMLSAAGLVVGCGLALAGVRVLRGLLWGIQPGDPVTYLSVCGVLLLVALMASVIPGLRVARIDPAQSLRDE